MLSEYFIGQTAAITQIQTAIDASKKRGVILPHTLFIAPPGVGKTQLARDISFEMNAPLMEIAFPASKDEVFNAMFVHFGILLLDEVHQASRPVMDALLPFLVDGHFKFGLVHAENKRLTIIAATTDPQQLPDAFRSRFRLEPRFTDYTDDEIAQLLIARAEREYRLDLTPELATGLANASLGNPRQAIQLLRTYIDLASLEDDVWIDDVLDHVGFTEKGLRPDHIQYLESLKRQGGVASKGTLSQMVLMPEGAMRWIERDLLRLGMISISSRGRELRVQDWGARKVTSEGAATGSSDLNPYTLEPH